MEKIESVKLLSNINYPNLKRCHYFGEELVKIEIDKSSYWQLKDETHSSKIFSEEEILSKPSWFEVIKKERFQLDTSKLLCNSNLKVINTSGNITTKSLLILSPI